MARIGVHAPSLSSSRSSVRLVAASACSVASDLGYDIYGCACLCLVQMRGWVSGGGRVPCEDNVQHSRGQHHEVGANVLIRGIIRAVVLYLPQARGRGRTWCCEKVEIMLSANGCTEMQEIQLVPTKWRQRNKNESKRGNAPLCVFASRRRNVSPTCERRGVCGRV